MVDMGGPREELRKEKEERKEMINGKGMEGGAEEGKEVWGGGKKREIYVVVKRS